MGDHRFHRFFVSGWEDDLNDFDEDRHFHDCPEREMLWAAENGKFDKVQQLIEIDATLVDVTDQDGYTPLHRACYGNHVEIVEYLLKNGANISHKTQLQWQPLHSCCQWNHKDCAAVLIQQGADVNAVSEGGKLTIYN